MQGTSFHQSLKTIQRFLSIAGDVGSSSQIYSCSTAWGGNLQNSKSCVRNQLHRYPKNFGTRITFLVASLLIAPFLCTSSFFTVAAPYLDSFDVDMTYGSITLEFSETMFGKTLDATKIIVQNNRTRACNTYVRSDCSEVSFRQLTGVYTVPRYNSSIISLILNEDDLIALLYDLNLYTELKNTYLTMDSGAIKNIYLEEATSVGDGKAMLASSFTGDSFKPVFQHFHMDMDAGTMMIVFNEPVNASSFRPAGISVQEKSNVNKGGEQYTLMREGVEIVNPNITNTFINISLGFQNVNLIRAAFPLCSTPELCHIGFTIDNLIRDVAGNPMSLLDTIYSAVAPRTYIYDTTRPELDYFSLDLDGGLLTLVFTETVDYLKFDLERITLQNKKLVVDTSVAGNRTVGLTYTFSAAGGTTQSMVNSWIIYIYIGDSDLNSIKLMYRLGTSKDSTFISFSEDLVKDMADISNIVVPRKDGNAAQVTYYTSDTTGPKIVDFSIDLNNRLLTLKFDEVVNATTANAGGITIQNARTASLSTTFSRQSETDSTNGLVVVFKIADKDFNGIKRIAGLGERRANTFLTATSITIGDMMGFETDTNYLQEIEDGSFDVTYATNYTADLQPPSLTSFDLNLNSKAKGNLTLVFSEPVDSSSLDTSKIILYGSRDMEDLFVQLTIDNSFTTSSDDTHITVEITGDDLNQIKLDDDIAFGPSYHCHVNDEKGRADDDLPPMNCYWEYAVDALGETTPMQNIYLTIDAAAVLDTFTYGTDGEAVQNDLIGISYDDVMGVSNFTQDATQPVLRSFDLDMDSGVQTLYFDEPVRTTTLNVTFLTLMQSYKGNTTHQLTLDSYYGSGSLSANGDTIKISLGEIDVDSIKVSQFLAIDADSTWLRIMPDTIQDMAGNGLFVQNYTHSVPVTYYGADTTGPELVSFDYDRIDGIFQLRFTEPVKIDTFNPSALTVQSQEKVGKTTKYTLTDEKGWSVPNFDSRYVYLNISEADLSALKSDSSLATGQSSTFLRTTTSLCRDMAKERNQNVQILDGYALNLGPVLLQYTLNMDSGDVMLFFSEPVDADNNFDPSGITFQESTDIDSTEGDESFTLTGADNVETSPDKRFLFFRLTIEDFDGLRILYTAAQSATTTFIVIDSSAILDLSTSDRTNNIGPASILPVVDGSASPEWEIPFAPITFTADTSRPNLKSFDLDMDSGILTLQFNEPLRAAQMQIDQILIQDEKIFVSNQTKFIALSGNSTTSSSDGRTILIDIQQKGGDENQDLDLLKITRGLCQSADNTFLSFTRFLGVDAAPTLNKLLPVSRGNATQVTKFTVDRTKPNLQSFDLDMNEGSLTLTFDEAVNVTIFDVTQITLQAEPDDETYAHTITSRSQVTNDKSKGSAVVHISIPESEIRTISKNMFVATSEADTYLTITADATTDIGTSYLDQNRLLAIETSSGGVGEVGALQVTTYTPDTTSPNLVAYALDMDSGVVELTFDEIVAKDSLDTTSITLQYAKYAGTSSEVYSIQNATNDVTNENDLKLRFTLGQTDMNRIKGLTGLAISPDTTFLRSTSNLVTDTAGNPMTKIVDGSAMKIASVNYTYDTTSPSCTSYVLQSNGYLIMQFSETVDYNTFNQSALRISAGPSSSLFYFLSSESIVYQPQYDTILSIQLNDDFGNLVALGLGISQLTSYLSFAKGLIDDTAGNKILSVPNSNPMLMGPSLNSYDLDMDEGTMKLYFSENVLGTATSPKPNNLTFDSTAINFINGNQNYTISQDTFATTRRGTEIKVELALKDVESIKLKRHLAVSASTSSLFIPAGSELSVNTNVKAVDAPNAVVPISSREPLAVSIYTPDTTAPEVDYYVIDKDEGLLMLFFTEPVNSNVSIPAITLQSSALLETGDSFYQLTQGSRLDNARDSKNLTVTFCRKDLNNVRALGVGAFLVIAEAFTRDLANPHNPLVAIEDGNGQAARRTIFDTTPPTLEAFSIDMGDGFIYMNFSEPVLPSTLNVTAIHFVDSVNSSKKNSISLTADTVTYSGAGLELTLNMNLVPTDLDTLKLHSTICKDAGSAFILIDRAAITDMAEYPNQIEKIESGNALAVTEFLRDVKRPELRSFDLDINPLSPHYKHLTLRFNEPIDASEVDVSKLKVQNGSDIRVGNVKFIVLSSSMQPSTDGNIIDIFLDDQTVERLTQITEVREGGANKNKTFLVAPKAAAVDMFFNPMIPFNDTEALQLGPTLASFTMDMDSSILSLQFSEPVNISSFRVDGLTFVGSSANTYYSLNDQNQTRFESQKGGSKIIIQLSENDMNSIKLVDNLGTLSTNTKVAVSSKMCHDRAFDPVQVNAINVIEALSPSIFSPDITAPKLIRIKFDLNTENGLFNLRFDEPVQQEAIVIGHITIQSEASEDSDTQSYTLTQSSGTRVVTKTSTHHTISLGYDDSAAIKILSSLATSLSSTYFSVKTKTFFDTSFTENTATTISVSSAFKVEEYIPDATDPYLKYFDIDMDEGELTLFFNEPVDVSSLQVEHIRIQSVRLRSDGESHRLGNGSYTPTSDLDTIVIVLSTFDYKAINDNEFLATGTTDTYITFPARTISDMAGNYVVEVQDGQAMAVAAYQADVTSPYLQEFDFDLDSGVLSLTFNEAVLGSNFDAPGITLQSLNKLEGTSGIDYQTFRLTEETTALFKQNNSEVIHIRLSEDDWNIIKYNEMLAVSANSTCLSMKATTVTDMSGNTVEAIATASAMTCNGDNVGFIYDTTQPNARTFDLDMDTGLMTITFSEPMNPALTTPSLIRLQQYSATSQGNTYKFTGGSYSRGVDEEGAIVYYQITEDDLNNIKALSLAQSDTTTWLTMKENAFYDVSVDYFYRTPRGNVLKAGSDSQEGNPLQVSLLTKDTTAPKMEKFVILESKKRLYLFLSEAVDIKSLDLTSFYIQNVESTVDNKGLNDDNNTFAVPLSATTTVAYGRDYTELILDLGATCMSTTECSLSGCVAVEITSCDWHTIEAAFEASSYAKNFYAVLSSTFIADFAANQIEAVGNLPSETRRLLQTNVNDIEGSRRHLSSSALAQSFPYCGPCMQGTQITPCTDIYDQVCGDCTNCTEGYFKSGECTPYLDTECTRCSECDYGFYVSQACDISGIDTGCSECTLCGQDEYEIDQCTAGSNTLCGSCLSCYFSSEKQRLGCHGTTEWWHKENCCYDRDGNKRKCKLTELEDFRIDARDSHRHWVWDKTYPAVPEGFEQGVWAGAV